MSKIDAILARWPEAAAANCLVDEDTGEILAWEGEAPPPSPQEVAEAIAAYQPPPEPRLVSPRAFWELVGPARRAQLYAARRNDVQLEMLIDDLNAGDVDLNAQRTRDGLDYCVARNYCTAAERDRLLAGEPITD